MLHQYFDGFLYWANWGSPRLALRFPHGILPVNLIDGYDFDDFVTFTKHPDYDILDMHFGEMEAPSRWTEYDLGSLISIRDELMEGDLRALYIAWLATMRMLGSYDEEEEDEDVIAPPVPPAFATLTKERHSGVSSSLQSYPRRASDERATELTLPCYTRVYTTACCTLDVCRARYRSRGPATSAQLGRPCQCQQVSDQLQ